MLSQDILKSPTLCLEILFTGFYQVNFVGHILNKTQNPTK